MPDYSWQEEALVRWSANGRCGIVEAITGTGKTYLGIKAIDEVMRRDGEQGLHVYPVVVVPTAVLLHQWVERLRDHFEARGMRIGLVGDGRADGFHNHHILVTIVNSLETHGRELLHFLDRMTLARSLLVADECHHYIEAPFLGKTAREFPFSYRLGLTARMPTGDCIDYDRIPGFDRVVYDMGMKEARERDLIPPFHVLNVPVPLTASEGASYDDLSARLKQLRQRLEEELPAACFSRRGHLDLDLLKNHLRKLTEDDPLRHRIEQFFAMCFRRAAIYHLSDGKVSALRRAIQIIAPYGGRILVFFERICSADSALELLEEDIQRIPEALGLRASTFPWCRVLHSGLTKAQRLDVLREYDEPGNKILIACRSLDEGFDIPSADIAILAASTQSPRQRIQRIGRVLRRYSSEKRSIILTFYAPGTGDERVPSNDREMFPGPTDVFDCTLGDWEATLKALLEYYRSK